MFHGKLPVGLGYSQACMHGFHASAEIVTRPAARFAQLIDYVLAVDPDNRDAKNLKAQALSELGERQISANARNFYLSSAQYLMRDSPAR